MPQYTPILPRTLRSTTRIHLSAMEAEPAMATHLIRTFLPPFTLCCCALAHAQIYPTKPVRIVTGAVAGSSDFGARLIAQGIAGPLGQPVVVDNRGGSVVIAAEAVARATPD